MTAVQTYVRRLASAGFDLMASVVTFFVKLPTVIYVFLFNICYVLVQQMIILLFKPRPPRTAKQPTKPRGRIAVVGAGLTGISSAAHAISHGFDVVIYEQSDKVGGIWANVNATSGLQLNSLLYRFHPAVCWSRAFPQRDEILKEITRIWREYKLEPRTRLSTQVTSVRRAKPEELKSVTEEELKPEKLGHARWIINDGQDGVFDAVIATVGTCGQPNMITLKGMPGWKEEQAKKQQDEEKRKDLAHEQEKEKKEKGGSHGERHGKRNPTAWTDMQKQNPDAVAEDQQEKKENNFLTPGEAYHGDGGDTVSVSSDEIATQDDGVWTTTKPQENAWDVGRDQVQKKEQGFPTPGEAFETGEDVQRGGEDKSLAEGKNEDNNDDANDTATKQQNGKAHVDEGDDVFKGPTLHSSQLDRKDAPSFEGKTVAIIGGGASAVEAVEAALAQGAQKCLVIAREDKWIIPRNIFVDTLIAMQPFGREMPLSFLWEKFIIKFNYHGVEDLAPAHLGLFESTPVVNDEFLGHVRHGRCKYIRGDTEELTSRGVLVNVRDRNSRSGDKGNKKEFGADIIVLATGFKKPDVNFIEKDLFPEAYERPNLYLQTFSTEDWSILTTNSAYRNAIGTVGHFHIGIYARILMTFLMDKDARPSPKDMKLWVDALRFVKRGAKGGALGFFTYMELTIWLFLFHIFRLDRIKWMLFILQGWGVTPREYYG